MIIVLIILIVALIAKDTSYLNDPYIMRGFAQGLCLVTAVIWFLSNLSFSIIKRYWMLFCYILILIFTAIISDELIYVAFQAISLASVILFIIALRESKGSAINDIVNTLTYTTILLYTFVMVISLLLIYLSPSLAYESMRLGNGIYEDRFRGLFSKSAMMGAATGLQVGLIWFGIKRIFLKFICLLPSAVCLLLTQSRTFWVASIIAGSLTLWQYYPNHRKLVIASVLIWFMIIITAFIFELSPDMTKAKKFIRTDSVSSLSGRTKLWKSSVDAFLEKPILGYGFTVGSLGLDFPAKNKSIYQSESDLSSRSIGGKTLHNGYIQAFLDSGIVGALFYIALIFFSIFKIWKYDRLKECAVIFYSLSFLAIANFAEDVIYSASIYHSVFFWMSAVFAIGFNSRNVNLKADYEDNDCNISCF